MKELNTMAMIEEDLQDYINNSRTNTIDHAKKLHETGKTAVDKLKVPSPPLQAKIT